ncbi:MAG TPA: type IV pili twitching motility protein PilT, partial [Dehalococcoidia bacterium]|nr:type IV pili twitching motility protein PilT [Dehalococcoidia bacterium]
MDIENLLRSVVQKEASDLHLRVFTPPVFRIDGDLIVQEEHNPLNIEDINHI